MKRMSAAAAPRPMASVNSIVTAKRGRLAQTAQRQLEVGKHRFERPPANGRRKTSVVKLLLPAEAETIHALAGGVAPFCTYEGIATQPKTLLECGGALGLILKAPCSAGSKWSTETSMSLFPLPRIVTACV